MAIYITNSLFPTVAILLKRNDLHLYLIDFLHSIDFKKIGSEFHDLAALYMKDLIR